MPPKSTLNIFKVNKKDIRMTSMQTLKVLSAIFLLACFVTLKESTCEAKKTVFYFTSKALFALEINKF